MRIHCFTDSYRYLVEATIDQTQKRVPIWTKQYFNDDADKALELLPDIIKADPTNGKYSEWLIKQWRDGTANFPEDIEKLSNSLTIFHAKKTRLQEKDINKYSPDSLASALEQELKLTQKELKAAQRGELMLPPGAELVLESGPYQFVKVTTVEAATQLSSRTEWCTANKPHATAYLRRGPLYVVYEDGERKTLISFEKDEFMDVMNKKIPVKLKFKFIDLLEPITGYSKQNKPRWAFEYARYVIEGRWPEGEEAIIKSVHRSLSFSDLAVKYAQDVIKGRWPEVEETIIKNVQLAVKYAQNVIQGRWPEAEEMIIKNIAWAYYYAQNVIKGRWPEAEEMISKNGEYACYYAIMLKKNGIMDRWPEGEEAISKRTSSAYDYAIHVIEGRWPEGEEAIRKDAEWWTEYNDFLKWKPYMHLGRSRNQ